MTWRKSGIIECSEDVVGKEEEVIGNDSQRRKRQPASHTHSLCSGVGCQDPMRPKPIVVPKVDVVEGELQPR